jgi:tungstate transport system substrate-binding protein
VNNTAVITVKNWIPSDRTRTKNHAFPARHYVIVGYMPTRFGKMYTEGMEVLVKGDLAMRRPYIVMEANPTKFPKANAAGARALSEFLLSETVQSFLLEFGRGTNGNGRALFFPIKGGGQASK